MKLFNLNTNCEKFSLSQKCAHSKRKWELDGKEEGTLGRKFMVRPLAAVPLAMAAIADTLLHAIMGVGTLVTGFVATPHVLRKDLRGSVWNDLTWGASVRHFSVALEHFCYILSLPICFIGSSKAACEMTDYRRPMQAEKSTTEQVIALTKKLELVGEKLKEEGREFCTFAKKVLETLPKEPVESVEEVKNPETENVNIEIQIEVENDQEKNNSQATSDTVFDFTDLHLSQLPQDIKQANANMGNSMLTASKINEFEETDFADLAKSIRTLPELARELRRSGKEEESEQIPTSKLAKSLAKQIEKFKKKSVATATKIPKELENKLNETSRNMWIDFNKLTEGKVALKISKLFHTAESIYQGLREEIASRKGNVTNSAISDGAPKEDVKKMDAYSKMLISEMKNTTDDDLRTELTDKLYLHLSNVIRAIKLNSDLLRGNLKAKLTHS